VAATATTAVKMEKAATASSPRANLHQKIFWLVAVFLASSTLQGHFVIGYSYEGHFAIANVAWELCSEETQQSIGEIMQRSDGFYELLHRDDRRCTEVCSPLAESAKVRIGS